MYKRNAARVAASASGGAPVLMSSQGVQMEIDDHTKCAIVAACAATQITEWQAAHALGIGIIEYREIEDELIAEGGKAIKQEQAADALTECGRLTHCGSPHCQCQRGSK